MLPVVLGSLAGLLLALRPSYEREVRENTGRERGMVLVGGKESTPFDDCKHSRERCTYLVPGVAVLYVYFVLLVRFSFRLFPLFVCSVTYLFIVLPGIVFFIC